MYLSITDTVLVPSVVYSLIYRLIYIFVQEIKVGLSAGIFPVRMQDRAIGSDTFKSLSSTTLLGSWHIP